MKKVAILGSSGYVINQRGRSVGEALSIAGANTGNFIFQYATRKMIGDTAEIYNIGLGEDSFWRNAGNVLDAVDLVVMPAANHLRLDADWQEFNRWLADIHKPFVVLGLGAQAAKGDEPSDTIAALKTNASVVRMCEILAERSVFVGVRGDFSRCVAEGLGIMSAEIVGCPSLMLSEASNLGHRLQKVLDRARSMERQVRVAMVAEAPYNIYENPEKLRIEQALFRLLRSVQGTYIQQSGGDVAIYAATGQMPEHLKDRIVWQLDKMAPDMDATALLDYLRVHGKVFFSAPDWIDYLRHLDLCIGHRFHGNMAAIAAERPGVVVTHDSRTTELVNTMCIPHVDGRVLTESHMSTADLLEGIVFDPESFDRNRSEIARRYIDVFTSLGVSLQEYVHTIGSHRNAGNGGQADQPAFMSTQ